jgi:hypothetical protein
MKGEVLTVAEWLSEEELSNMFKSIFVKLWLFLVFSQPLSSLKFCSSSDDFSYELKEKELIKSKEIGCCKKSVYPFLSNLVRLIFFCTKGYKTEF